MKPNTTESPEKPWYRIGMVWLMLGLPFAVVIASMVTLVIAHRNAPLIVSKQEEVSKLQNQSDVRAVHSVAE